MLMVDRAEKRFGEQIARWLCKPIQYIFPKLLTTPIETLANSMIAKTIFSEETPKKVELIDNNEIFSASDLYTKSNLTTN